MISRDLQTQTALAQVAKVYPQVVEYLRAWELSELHKLPFNTTNTAVAQGRCQVLGELIKTIEQAPDTADSLKAQSGTHTK